MALQALSESIQHKKIGSGGMGALFTVLVTGLRLAAVAIVCSMMLCLVAHADSTTNWFKDRVEHLAIHLSEPFRAVTCLDGVLSFAPS